MSEHHPEVTSLRRITPEHVKSYLAHLHRHGMSAASRNQVLTAIKALLTSADLPGVLRSIKRASTPTTRPAYLTRAQAADLLASVDDSWDGRRDAVLIRLFLATGCRSHELLPVVNYGGDSEILGGLTLDRVDLRGSHICVTGKGSRDRVVPLNAEIVQALREWLSVRPDTKHKYLFTLSTGEPLSYGTFSARYDNICKRAGITGEHARLHTLRHTVGTWLHEAGVDVVEIARYLGDTVDVVVRHYVGHSDQRMSAAAALLTM